MALISCPNCGNEISDRARACPKCGCIIATKPVVKGKKGNGVLYAIIVLLLLIIIGFCVYIFAPGKNESGNESISNVPSHVSSDPQSVASVKEVTVEEKTTTVPEKIIDLNEDGRFYLTGTVAGLGCEMNITIDGSSVEGTYSYNKYKKPMGLKGTKYGNEVRLDEIDIDGDVTGELNGYIDGNTFKGTHTRYLTLKETQFSFKAQ